MRSSYFSDTRLDTAKFPLSFKSLDEEIANLEKEDKRFDLELDLDLDILSHNIAGDASYTKYIS